MDKDDFDYDVDLYTQMDIDALTKFMYRICPCKEVRIYTYNKWVYNRYGIYTGNFNFNRYYYVATGFFYLKKTDKKYIYSIKNIESNYDINFIYNI